MQYLKKEVGDEVDFLRVDKHESFPQINSMNLRGMVKHTQGSQKSKFATSWQYLKREVSDKIDFLHADFNILDIKVSYKIIPSLLKGMIKHFQSTQSNKFAISLQYFKK